jgi:hypothetical protein
MSGAEHYRPRRDATGNMEKPSAKLVKTRRVR